MVFLTSKVATKSPFPTLMDAELVPELGTVNYGVFTSKVATKSPFPTKMDAEIVPECSENPPS